VIGRVGLPHTEVFIVGRSVLNAKLSARLEFRPSVIKAVPGGRLLEQQQCRSLEGPDAGVDPLA
jgi:hypothetical protein